jgi:hypothetical protein
MAGLHEEAVKRLWSFIPNCWTRFPGTAALIPYLKPETFRVRTEGITWNNSEFHREHFGRYKYKDIESFEMFFSKFQCQQCLGSSRHKSTSFSMAMITALK